MAEEIDLRRNAQYIVLGGIFGAIMSIGVSIFLQFYVIAYFSSINSETAKNWLPYFAILLVFLLGGPLWWVYRQDKIIETLRNTRKNHEQEPEVNDEERRIRAEHQFQFDLTRLNTLENYYSHGLFFFSLGLTSILTSITFLKELPIIAFNVLVIGNIACVTGIIIALFSYIVAIRRTSQFRRIYHIR